MQPKQNDVPKSELKYTLISDEKKLKAWVEQHKNAPWIAFDTEFIGEKRYRTLICLIQVASPDGLYIIDPLSIADLGPFLTLIEDPAILKITHAGENDYRLLYQNFGCKPQNMLDTQLACGFLSAQYPVNFKRLAAEHLSLNIEKGYAVSDWTKRPLQSGALRYALEDVMYLREMLDVVSEKLRQLGRYEWFESEMQTWEDVKRYDKTIIDEVKNFSSVFSMRRGDKLFLLRLVEWRRSLAEKRDHSREMVLPTKDMLSIVKLIKNGRKAFETDRRLSSRSWMKYFDEWQALFAQKPLPEEEELVDLLREPESGDLRQEVVGEMLYRYLSFHCAEKDIAIDLVVPRSVIRDLRVGSNAGFNDLISTWRSKFLGDDVLFLLGHTDQLIPKLEGRTLHFVTKAN